LFFGGAFVPLRLASRGPTGACHAASLDQARMNRNTKPKIMNRRAGTKRRRRR
jgi:hypothetical protein